ncbi:sugar porter family MFS transporter [Rhizomonospora bruguierae]|uniref:sugar porter family MFS transporter n=1 Tax=Rhizomonospora bruguierae TaxID=1581705 RepID=UPI0020C147E8|nr:sugar porter family MFS transporter [Micromonospora sp. NBRC 107566]
MVMQMSRAVQDVVRVSAAAALGGFLFGYDTGVVNGSVPAISRAFAIHPGTLGFVIAAALLGAAVGAWFAGPFADRVGRRRVMLLGGLLFAVGSIGAALALGPLTLTYWRVIQGLGFGATSVMAAAYIAEIAPAHLRGRLGTMMQLAIVAGIALSLLISLVISEAAGLPHNPGRWRWLYAFEAIPGLVFAYLSTRIPESPRYLVEQGRDNEARAVLDRFEGGDVDARVEQIRRSSQGGGDRVSDDVRELRGPRLGLQPVIWVGILLAAFQQLVGINVVFYYSTTVWETVGFRPGQALFTSFITGLLNLAATVVAVLLIDRVGRRPLLLAGSTGMAVTLLVLALTFRGHVEGQPTRLGPVAGGIALIAFNLFVVSFAVSWGPVMWVLLGEMFPNRIRAIALAVATGVNWVANWLISATFPALASAGLPVAYGIFTAFAILSLLFVLRSVRETRGLQLEQM